MNKVNASYIEGGVLYLGIRKDSHAAWIVQWVKTITYGTREVQISPKIREAIN